MNKTLIFRKIGGIISEITEQYQYLAENPENINLLELELFIANAHFLSEHLAILKKIENTTEHATPLLAEKIVPIHEPSIEVNSPVAEGMVLISQQPEVTNEAQQIFENPAEVKAEEALIPGEVVAESNEINQTIDQLFNQYEATVDNDTEYHHEAIAEEHPISPDAEETKAEDLPENLVVMPLQEVIQPVNHAQTPETMETKPVTDEKVPTLNEILAVGKSGESMAAKISRNEDKDLRGMIKLNEKLMFVRDLFNGYSLAYSEAIDRVNRFDNFKSAENFLLQNYAVKNRWSEKQQTVDQFYEVLHKRFS